MIPWTVVPRVVLLRMVRRPPSLGKKTVWPTVSTWAVTATEMNSFSPRLKRPPLGGVPAFGSRLEQGVGVGDVGEPGPVVGDGDGGVLGGSGGLDVDPADSSLWGLVPGVLYQLLDELPGGAASVLFPHPLVGYGEAFFGRHGLSFGWNVRGCLGCWSPAVPGALLQVPGAGFTDSEGPRPMLETRRRPRMVTTGGVSFSRPV